jgi:hypothetical protein
MVVVGRDRSHAGCCEILLMEPLSEDQLTWCPHLDILLVLVETLELVVHCKSFERLPR